MDIRPRATRMMTRDADPSQTNKVATRLHEIRERGGLRRVAEFGAVDLEARTAELSFSSEDAEVSRWFGIEKLSHAPGAVDLSRLNNSAPLLWMHNWNDQRGVIEPNTARIDGDRKGRAVVRFSRSPDGEQMMQDVADKIITKVSVGYLVNGMRLQETRDDDDVYLVTEWQPFEISGVSVPADDTVGFGRSAEIPREEPTAKPAENPTQVQSRTTPKGNETMNEKILRDAAGNLVRAQVDENGAILKVLEVLEQAGAESRAAQARGQDAERARVRELTEMGRQYDANDLALEHIASGASAQDMQRALLGRFADQRNQRPMSDQVKDGEVGLTDKEARSYSIMRAIRALANPTNTAFQKEAAFEMECSRAAQEKSGKQSRGIMIPADVLNRAFSTTTPAGGPGSNAIATNLLADQFIELLRHRTWALKRVTTMGGLVGNVDIPRQNSAAQAYWIGEGADVPESEPGIDQIGFSPKTLSARTEITRRLMLQSTPDAELIVRNDLLKVMALALDHAVIYGSGAAGQPKGLLQQTGIHAVALADVYPAFAEYVQMETDIAAADADLGSLSYVINARARGAAKTTLKFPGVNGSQTIWEQGNTINGYTVDVTNQLTDGDSFFGNWADFIIGMWSGLDMMVDPYSLSASGGTRIVLFQDVDMNIRHKESFTYASKTATPAP
ncbi:major head protein [Burkholderia phage Mica]|uniref:Major capsid protein n=1 Tax=Burkholderia phage Mica TaxID=2767579 RepID=A0A873WEX5_9CAUD|nr:major head protein [Burkholderia phage Mica]QPB08618.1 major capsid protein [Burkholderia phage Mica]